MVRLLESDGPWIRRRRRALLENFRPNARIARVVADLHRRMRFSAFFGRYFDTVQAGTARLGPSVIDLDDLRPEGPGERDRLVQRARRRLMSFALRDYQTVYVPRFSDLSFVQHPRVVVLPCISTQVRCLPAAEEVGPPRMLFVGPGGFEPNRDGLDHFVRACLPAILSRVPDASLTVVGTGWEHLRGAHGVELTGFVSELAPEYARAHLCLCPTRTGPGAKVKLAEALGFGRATVATPHAAAGFTDFVVPGRDLVIGEDDRAFTEACVALLLDPARRRKLGQHAARAAEQYLSQGAVDRIVRETLPLEPPRPPL